MKKNLFLLFSLVGSSAYSQSITPAVFSTAGTVLTGGATSVSITLGEPCTTTLTASGNAITQGFQQPHFSAVSVEEHTELGISVSVFPNPATETIQLNFSSTDIFDGVKVQLFDLQGKVLKDAEVSNTHFSMDLRDFSNGVYFIKVLSREGILISNHKIQKIN